MSKNSNNQGRAFEYACITSLHQKTIEVNENSEIEYNSAYEAAERAWNSIPIDAQDQMKLAAECAANVIFDLEPCIIDKELGKITFRLQKDQSGTHGDVRDIVLSQEKSDWEIGLSIKNNHYAVKHSRLSRGLDFGKNWYGISCSSEYWEQVNPVFSNLSTLKEKKIKWSDVLDKDNSVYKPILNGFLIEVLKAYNEDSSMVKRLVEYLVGMFDYYKVVSVSSDEETIIQTYNIHGSLNKSSTKAKPKILIPKVNLPTRIIHFGFKPNSNTTLELYMDEGWQLSFRIHNASTTVEPSLKFDVQFVGAPTSVSVIRCQWRKRK